MEYNREKLEEIFDECGEVMVIMDSGVEYELHTGNTEFFGEHLTAEGIRDGEYLSVVIPYAAVEHHYTHAAL